MPESGKELFEDRRGNENKKKKRRLLIPLLLVFVSISSFLAGTHVGKSTDQRLGQMLDTIVLSPEVKKADKNRIDFSGQVLYTDGTPCANQKIELHSDPMRTITDAEGFFCFANVEIGEHHLSILDETGSPVSEMTVQIERNKDVKAGQVKGSADICYLSVAEKVVQIHVKVRLDEKEGLTVDEEVYTRDEQGICMDQEGREVSPVLLDKASGTASQNQSEQPPVSGENLMSPENGTQSMEPGQSAETGFLQITDGAGNSLATDRTASSQAGTGSTVAVQTVPGTISSPETSESPSVSEGATDPSNTGTADTGTSNGGNHGNSGGGGGSHTKPEPTKPTESTTPTEPTKPTEPTEPTKPTEPTVPEEPLDVAVKEKGGPVWTQQTAISLFADRTGAGADRKLMPGSRGSYEFQVENYNSYGITYRMQISAPEGQLLLPLRYRLKSGGRYVCGDDYTWLDAGQLSAEAVSLSAGEEKEYLLEWQWLFEGGDDELDTKIGSAENLEYEVIITIHIEQTVS